MTINFWLDGQEFTALNGGPQFQFTHAISFVVNCNNQAEIDYYWEKLSAFGKMEPCGWLKDQFGVSWQIVPTLLKEFFKDSESGRAERTMEEMIKMTKIDLATLEKAYHGSNPGPTKLSPRKRAKKIAMNK
jgi:predicted 3-demethylubiquinone-9 3-methyltransferase (glyoxalase superfamily)